MWEYEFQVHKKKKMNPVFPLNVHVVVSCIWWTTQSIVWPFNWAVMLADVENKIHSILRAEIEIFDIWQKYLQISDRMKSLSFFKLYQIKYSLNTALLDPLQRNLRNLYSLACCNKWYFKKDKPVEPYWDISVCVKVAGRKDDCHGWTNVSVLI